MSSPNRLLDRIDQPIDRDSEMERQVRVLMLAKFGHTPFLRTSVNGEKMQTVAGQKIEGSSDMYVVVKEVPLGQSMVFFMFNKGIMKKNDKKHETEVEGNCAILLSWGKGFEKYELCEGYQAIFFSESEEMVNVTVMGNAWVERPMEELPEIFNIRKGLSMMAIGIPDFQLDIEFRLVQVLGEELDWENVSSKEVTFDGICDVILWCYWGSDDFEVTEVRGSNEASPALQLWHQMAKRASSMAKKTDKQSRGLTDSASDRGRWSLYADDQEGEDEDAQESRDVDPQESRGVDPQESRDVMDDKDQPGGSRGRCDSGLVKDQIVLIGKRRRERKVEPSKVSNQIAYWLSSTNINLKPSTCPPLCGGSKDMVVPHAQGVKADSEEEEKKKVGGVK